ncbi:hypothetical protein FB548_2681 [Pseudoxanthomonas sp. 3HH-4]|nr:hypothetical protein FB548_2681 [Pseudoxanthomonas sp. 3HH-4]
MRSSAMVVLLGLGGCTGLGAEQAGMEAGSSAPPESRVVPVAPTVGPFAGKWEACDGTNSPDECSRYVLLQHDDRVCGTWSYFASGKVYEGRIVARATSSVEARRTHVCGRPGSETQTECDDGWQRIDKPLRLCDGKLADLTRADGTCVADHQAVPMPDEERYAVQAQPWIRECLSRVP